MTGGRSLEEIVELVLRRLRALLGAGPCPLCGSSDRPPAPAPAERPPPRAGGSMVHEHPGRLLSEEEVVRVHRQGVRALRLSPRCLVTPAARDRARDLRVDLFQEGSPHE